MATKRPTKPRRTLLQEATDPATAPERLRELARHHKESLRREIWKNPSLPEDVLHDALVGGNPEAWDNPMAPLHVLTWTPRESDQDITIEDAAFHAMKDLWTDSTRCSSESKLLIASKVQEWWVTSERSSIMMHFLGVWAKVKGNGSSEHREVLRILLLCVRTAPNLTLRDIQAIEILEAWSVGGEDRRNKADELAFSKSVEDAVNFAINSFYDPGNAAYEVLDAFLKNKEIMDSQQAKVEHQRLLADLIRQEMPSPPVVT